MALWISNSFLRTKSFQIQSVLPPLLSPPPTTTTTTRTWQLTRSPTTKSPSSSFEPTSETPKCPKDREKSKTAGVTEKVISWYRSIKVIKKLTKKSSSLLSTHELMDIDTLLQSLVEARRPSKPIVFAGEARRLEERLGEAAMGKAFLLQAGDYDESFKEFNADNVPDTLRVILQMSAVLMFGGQIPVIKVGNQFTMPRSDTFIEKDGMKFDNLNVDALDLKSSTSHPQELIKAYHPQTRGYAAMQRVNQWNLDFMENNEHGDRYRELASQVDEAIGYMSVASLTVDHFWTSHEHSLTCKDSTSSLSYDSSAHFLWVGERTRQLDGEHVNFLKRIANPLGIMVSDKMDPNELVKLIDILNPENKPGRITIVTRMGADNIKVKLPNIVRKVKSVGQIVTWVTDPDPMPCNTIKAPSSLKAHPFDAIQAEVRAFFDVHEQEKSYPGGVHLKMTGQKETKRNGGSRSPTSGHTNCDPRLNASESLELAFIIAERLRKQRITAQSTN